MQLREKHSFTHHPSSFKPEIYYIIIIVLSIQGCLLNVQEKVYEKHENCMQNVINRLNFNIISEFMGNCLKLRSFKWVNTLFLLQCNRIRVFSYFKNLIYTNIWMSIPMPSPITNGQTSVFTSRFSVELSSFGIYEPISNQLTKSFRSVAKLKQKNSRNIVDATQEKKPFTKNHYHRFERDPIRNCRYTFFYCFYTSSHVPGTGGHLLTNLHLA